mmetsp:Transcript_3442/g.8198  ORF Transcript_3442/g.8198 Transcript_3442/m.8198 type:complete len:87 (+) Transcript_3442:3020-3280(+)
MHSGGHGWHPASGGNGHPNGSLTAAPVLSVLALQQQGDGRFDRLEEAHCRPPKEAQAVRSGRIVSGRRSEKRLKSDILLQIMTVNS